MLPLLLTPHPMTEPSAAASSSCPTGRRARAALATPSARRWRQRAAVSLASLGAGALLGACGVDERLGRFEAPPAPTLDASAATPQARYVFLFIGDGMGSAQVSAAEAFLAARKEADEVGGSAKSSPLGMSRLPVRGVQRTSSYDSLITDSAAAGTALATGSRTNGGVIGLDPASGRPLTTIAELAKDSGMKVGIVTSVSLDHGTPAAFYAHVPSRGDYHEIGHALVASGFDYFGGGGLLDPDGAQAGATPHGNVLEAARDAGYAIARTRDAFSALAPGTPAVAIGPVLDDRQALYYELDRVGAADDTAHISLAELTRKGIDLLHSGAGRSQGFFLMVEGGKIDWACHVNDARTTIAETLALDDAVAVAVDFWQSHPAETLIVVTADHETGGLSLGWTGTGYSSALEVLAGQRVSFFALDQRIQRLRSAEDVAPTLAESPLATALSQDFALDYATLSAPERASLDAAYDRAMFAIVTTTPAEDRLLYGGHNALSVAATRILSQRAGLGWTTFAHTAVPVPVLAGGAGAEGFAGEYDNVEIAVRLARSMRLVLPD